MFGSLSFCSFCSFSLFSLTVFSTTTPPPPPPSPSSSLSSSSSVLSTEGWLLWSGCCLLLPHHHITHTPFPFFPSPSPFQPPCFVGSFLIICYHSYHTTRALALTRACGLHTLYNTLVSLSLSIFSLSLSLSLSIYRPTSRRPFIVINPIHLRASLIPYSTLR
ncbi:hypothetical protein IWZ03DRAFT_58797 [Phyllosticta citriasiana]|uniref:Uncharacterized protein n=1 Tax=Phyllosticta citriasiana TaxID=595635 RepID=A0ABR1KAY5_9PEZI